MNKAEVFFIDGPVVYTSHSLSYLTRHPYTPWFGLQHVVKFTRVYSIEDYELLLYVVLTDRFDIRSRNDSYNCKLKFFMNYTEVIQFVHNLLPIADQLMKTLQAGSNTRDFAISTKNHIFRFRGFFDQNANIVVQVELEDIQSKTKGVVSLTTQKFIELVAALDSIKRNWHSTLTMITYQFDRFGRAFNVLQQEVSQLKHLVQKLVDKLESINLQSIQVTHNKTESNKSIQQISKPQKQFPISEFIQPQQEKPQTITPDNIISKVDAIFSKKPKENETKSSNEQQSSKPAEDESHVKLPLSIITHVELLKPYVESNEDLYSFALDNQKELTRIFIASGIPENYVNDIPKLVDALYTLKDVFEGKEVKSILGMMLSDILKGGSLDEVQVSTG